MRYIYISNMPMYNMVFMITNLNVACISVKKSTPTTPNKTNTKRNKTKQNKKQTNEQPKIATPHLWKIET